MHWLDSCCATLLPLLTVWILLSGIDDLVVDLVWALRKRRPQPSVDSVPASEPRVALFVPLWREDRVIGRMLEHTLSAIRYTNYAIFAGGYPNDEPTLAVIREAQARFPQLHLAVCPHDGPTSKADCLNWIYQFMLLEEQRQGIRFDLIVVHDAEDLIDPEGLNLIAAHDGRYGMVQLPVLPLRTPLYKLTHGVYCDEFTEYQTRDMPSRGVMGSFLPSTGVGVGYTRAALERLAASHNRVFDPTCLTEDYDNGLRLHRLGFPQRFVPIRFYAGRPLATREYFPQSFRSALRQRTRWIMGNALQAWQRYGWSGGPRQAYWFWRDRKGLIGNPLSAAANLILAYGIVTWLAAWHSGAAWGLGAAARPYSPFLLATLLLQIHRLAFRMACVGRVYGWLFAAGVPVRVLWANALNAAATAAAVVRYTRARVLHLPLVWLKTEHVYPSRAALIGRQRPLGELLVRLRILTKEQLRRALDSQPAGVRLGEYLIFTGALDEDELYAALSLQQSVPFEPLDAGEIPLWVARALPGSVARRWRVVPFKIANGGIYVAGPELPGEEAQRDLERHTPLPVRFQYITPSNYKELTAKFLAPH